MSEKKARKARQLTKEIFGDIKDIKHKKIAKEVKLRLKDLKYK